MTIIFQERYPTVVGRRAEQTARLTAMTVMAERWGLRSEMEFNRS